MNTARLRHASLLGLALAIVTTSVAITPPATASDTPHDRIVSADPANWTPHALDNSVLAIQPVGDAVVAGGDFTRIATSDRGTELDQAGVFAFDASTGDLLTDFLPQVTGGSVEAVAAHPDGDKVFIGGSFSHVNGVKWPKLALLSLTDGSLVTDFAKAPMDGKVLDLAVSDDRLIVSGAFTSIKGEDQGNLASLSLADGSFDPFMSVDVTGTHNGGRTAVLKFDISATGSRLVAIGNFTTVDGLSRRQVVALDLTGPTASVANWQTGRFAEACSNSFDTYMREVDIDPEGQYFVIVTTGAYRSGRMCDSASRWELRDSGSNLQPTWISYTGGDTLYSVAATNTAVYVGGHQRWHNNSFAGDRAGAGAVEREGIAALDPLNGLPLTWNPGRDRGVGAFALTATDDGLWVGSDTDRIGRWEYHGRLAFFPLAGGTVPPTIITGDVPGHLLSLGTDGGNVVSSAYDGAQVGSTTEFSGAGVTARAATMISGDLFMAKSNGSLARASWSDGAVGAATTVPDLNLSAWRTELANMTGMYYHGGRLYFTLSGNSNLYYRYFSLESGVIGADRLTATASLSGINFASVAGMTAAGDDLLWVESATGNLNRTALNRGIPTAGTTSTVSGPAIDGTDWRRGALVLKATADGTPSNLPPVANAQVTCDGLDCFFTSVGSGDPDGQVVSRQWDLGDGTVVNGLTVSHTYDSEGPFTATLTVTDNDGATAVATVAAQPDAAPAAVIDVTCDGLTCQFDGSASTDGSESPVAYAWSFGDGTTAEGASVQHTYNDSGSFAVELTVTDDEGGSASEAVSVSVAAATESVAFVDATSANTNSTTVAATIPAGTAAGDGLLLVLTGNRTDVVYAPPTGWQEVARVDDGDMMTIAWQRRASGSDAGSSVELSATARTKMDLQLLSYRGVDFSVPLTAATSRATTFTTEHTTPTVDAAAGDVALLYWADKTSATTDWVEPARDDRSRRVHRSRRRTSHLAGGGAGTPDRGGHAWRADGNCRCALRQGNHAHDRAPTSDAVISVGGRTSRVTMLVGSALLGGLTVSACGGGGPIDPALPLPEPSVAPGPGADYSQVPGLVMLLSPAGLAAEPLGDGDVVPDVFGSNHDAVAVVPEGAPTIDVETDDELGTQVLSYPELCDDPKTCLRPILEVADARSLNPGVRDFTVVSTVRVADTETSVGLEHRPEGVLHRRRRAVEDAGGWRGWHPDVHHRPAR